MNILGTCWVLLKDESDVQFALNWYDDDQAKIRGEPIKLSVLNINLTNIDNINQLIKKSEVEMSRRKHEQAEHDRAHRALIRKSYKESQERHAYRLAHPAYADGRIW